ncbi:serine/threonine-protein kinase [Nocardiopsis flavescens]|uniref:serine/threonine-protein kinase n=1 Tax=Nocardiopsis flavescens TaxID=758803 RepID=UPI00364ACDAB
MQSLKDHDPRALGDIAVLGRLGTGGMGVVYAGRTADGTAVAVKTMREDLSDQSELRERFDREAAALAMVQGTGTAGLVSHSAPGDDPQWLAMEYVSGLDLSAYVKGEGPLDATTGTALAFCVTDALASVHAAGLLHRDLKPSNIMLGPTGPLVIDFGLVAIGGAGGELTVTGAHMGTPLFMAPEQFGAADKVAAGADVYALGAVLAYTLTGRHAYTGPTDHAVRHAICDPEVAPDLEGAPAELAPLLRALLSVDPQDRPPLVQVRLQLTERLAVLGLTPGGARRLVAERTHIPGVEIPDVAGREPQERRRERAAAAAAPTRAGTGIRRAAAVADRLRRGYARPAA